MEGNGNCSDAAAHNQFNKIETKNHHEIANLPEEIIQEILLRLPVKSLLRFMCVSKSWLSLISSRQFVNTHLQVSSRDADFTNRRILFTSYENCFNLKQCSVNSLMSKSSPLFVYGVDYPNKSMYGHVKVVGSCNGLVCIEIAKKEVFLWNPSTRKSRAVPIEDETRKRSFNMWGFGFVESEDDYKVVCDFYKYPKVSTKIYSLRTDSWKKIERAPAIVNKGKLVNEKLHFLPAWQKENYCKLDIGFLDLKTGAYGIMKQPDYEDDGWSDPRWWSNSRRGVWVMKEYGVKESWTKVASIPNNDPDPDALLFLRPLLIMPNGEIFLLLWDSIMVYNPEDNCVKYIQLCNFRNNLQAQNYVESLVHI